MKLAGKGFALWLIPEEPIFNLLAAKISLLSQEYSTPRFNPHVTLLSGITVPEDEARAKSASLARSLKPFRVELADIDYLDEYFRCLFVCVNPTGSILKAHKKAQDAFGLLNEAPYMPHLSLMYGELQIETKRRIAAGLGSIPGQVMEVHRLALYRVSGVPQEWKCVEQFRLS